MASFDVKVSVELDVNCAECGAPLEVDASTDRWGNTTLSVTPCEKCIEKAQEKGRKEAERVDL